MNPITPCARAGAFSLVLSLGLAQAPSAWSEISPPGGVDPAKLQTYGQGGLGKLACYRDGQYLRVYSTVTGRWYAHTPSFGTSTVLLGDILLVPESDRWVALSAQRGVFDTLLLGSALPLSITTSNLAVVRDGTTVHFFAAATGRWLSRTVPTSWSIAATEQLVVFSAPQPAGGTFGGCEVYETFSGTWHTLPPQQAVYQRAAFSAGTGMFLFQRPDNSTFAATYTTHAPGWTLRAVQAQPPLWNLGGGGEAGADFVAIWNIAYSGLTDQITTLGLDVAPTTGGCVSLAYDTTTQRYHAAGILGQGFLLLPAGVDTYYSTAPMGVRVFSHGALTLAYNGIDGSTATVAAAQGVLPVGGRNGMLVGAVADQTTREVSVYSAATSQWHPTPANTLPEPAIVGLSAAPYSTATAVFLRTTTGLTAFSGRTAAFVPLAGSGYVRHSSGAAYDQTNLAVFDSRSDRWLVAPIGLGSLQQLEGSERGFVAAAGQRAIGFGPAASRFEPIDLAEPVLAHGELDGGGFVRTATRLYAFSGLPETLTTTPFPEGVNASAPGSEFRAQTSLPPGALAVLALSAPTNAPASLPGLGTLWLDPASAVVVEVLVPPAGEQRALTSFRLPTQAALHRTGWTLQSLVLPAQGQPYLSAFTSLWIL